MKESEEADRVSLEGAQPKPTLLRRLTLLLDRSRALRGRLEAARSRSRLLDVSFDVIERDSDIGGGILAGALAYRLFVFFLPLAFLLVSALGLLSRWFDVSPQEIGRDVGVVSLVTKEVAASSRSGTGWWVALVAAVALAYVTAVLHRAVAIVHALAWQRSAAAAKTERSLGVFVLGLAGQLVLTAGTGPLHPPTGFENILVLVAYPLAIGAIWLSRYAAAPARRRRAARPPARRRALRDRAAAHPHLQRLHPQPPARIEVEHLRRTRVRPRQCSSASTSSGD